jgi:DnaJ-domain-containing protein 1
MIGHAYEDRGFWETVFNSSAAVEPNRQEQAWPLAEEIQQLMGDDAQPDPLFFEESWTLGAAVAAENLRRRRRQQAEFVSEGVVFGEYDNLGAQAYVQQRAWWAEPIPTAQDYAVAGQSNSEWQMSRGKEPAARKEDIAREPNSAQRVGHVEMSDPAMLMTVPLACRLLGVTATSSREQIRNAYRRMAGQWHPDRMQHSNEETRHFANEQMIAINQAYSLLRERMMQQAA